MKEKTFFKRVKDAGGSAYSVGGSVRDMLMKRAVHDRDYVVCGLTPDVFYKIFPKALQVGRSFPVFLLEIEGAMCETAFARRERKCGRGYKGFDVYCAPEISIEEDLYRRDTTINSMARDGEGNLIDPYGGARDIELKTIRATSEHFREDPVRALRAARQSAQFEFTIEEKTLAMMKECAEELRGEPRERKFAELKKALEAKRPSLYFTALLDAGLLEEEFPWIYRLIGKTQPSDKHPEGDAFAHSMLVLDYVSAKTIRPEVRFAALMHDIGKGETPEEMLPHHYEHEARGVEIIKEIAKALRLPREWKRCAEFAAREHMHPKRFKTPEKMRDIIRSLEKEPIGAEGFAAIVEADNQGECPKFLLEYEKNLEILKQAAKTKIPENLIGAQIGEYIREKEINALREAIGEEGE